MQHNTHSCKLWIVSKWNVTYSVFQGNQVACVSAYGTADYMILDTVQKDSIDVKQSVTCTVYNTYYVHVVSLARYH